MVVFRRDLYRGTAADYDRHRPAYPNDLLTALVDQVPRRRRLLDIACGTGQLARPLAASFDAVVAFDQEPDSVSFAERRYGAAYPNVRWHVGRAEDLDEVDAFDLVVIGNAFHRLDRAAVARRVRRALTNNGVFALVWGQSPMVGDAPWQRAARELIDRWRDRLNVGDRVPANWREAEVLDPNPAVLDRAGFAGLEREEFGSASTWTAEALLGFVFSTSYLSRAALGTHRAAFEADWYQVMAAFGEPLEPYLSFALETTRPG